MARTRRNFTAVLILHVLFIWTVFRYISFSFFDIFSGCIIPTNCAEIDISVQVLLAFLDNFILRNHFLLLNIRYFFWIILLWHIEKNIKLFRLLTFSILVHIGGYIDTFRVVILSKTILTFVRLFFQYFCILINLFILLVEFGLDENVIFNIINIIWGSFLI